MRNFLKYGIYLGIVIVSLPFLAVATANLLPGFHSYIVASGSMEPAIPTGSVLFTKNVDPEKIDVGEVITYRKDTGREKITHRVIQKNMTQNGPVFRTKGDANDEPDPGWIEASNVESKKILAIPYMGRILQPADKKKIILILVFLPATLLVAFEARNLLKMVPDDYGEISEMAPAIAAVAIVLAVNLVALLTVTETSRELFVWMGITSAAVLGLGMLLSHFWND